MTVIAAVLSLGLNTPVYRWLYDHVWALGGFRAPARFAILVCCGLAVLAGFGFASLQQAPAARRAKRVLFVAVLAVVGIEYGSLPMYLMGRARAGAGHLQVREDARPRRHDRASGVGEPLVRLLVDDALAPAGQRVQRLHPA